MTPKQQFAASGYSAFSLEANLAPAKLDAFERQLAFVNQRDTLTGLHFRGSSRSGNFSYEVTNRGYDELEGDLYPIDWLLQMKPGMSVLDIGAGKGQLVRDLRRHGVNACGIDKTDDPGEAVSQLDMADLNQNSYPNQYDRILSTWSIFSYPSENPAFQKDCLKKMANWVKPGGKIWLSPVNYLLDNCWLKGILPPNLKVTSTRICEGKFLGRPVKCIELTRQN